MGGIEGSRGYSYQAFASVLEALGKDYWDKIHVEFKTENDKVDIALELQEEITKTIQVKSSVNLFSKKDILEWLLELIDDFSSKEYSLHLIGSCNSEANILIKSLNKYKAGIKDGETKNSLEGLDSRLLDKKVSIKVIPFEPEVLEGVVRDSLNKYISEKGFTVNYYGLELIAKGIEMTFMLLSTQGKYITKKNFDEKVINWLKITLGEYLSSSYNKSNHEISFYLKSEQKFCKHIDEINILESHGYKSLKDEYIKQIRDTKAEIDKIKLPLNNFRRKNINAIAYGGENLHNILSQMNGLLSDKKEEYFLEFSDENKREIIKDIKDILGVDISGEFFHMGKLKEIKTVRFMNKTSYEQIGTYEEKEKYNHIIKLEYLIMKYKYLNMFIDRIVGCSVLPLVIQNISELSDNDLKIKLYIPKEVRIFKPSDYIWDDKLTFMLEELVEKEGIIDTIFTFKPDGNVSLENKISLNDFRNINLPLIGIYGDSYSKYTSDDFYKVLKMNIEQDTYVDDKDYNIVKYNIKQLHSKENKALINTLIIYSLKEDIKIKYKVLSANSDGSVEGFLEVNKRHS